MFPTIRTTIGDYYSNIEKQLVEKEFQGIYVIACYPSLGCLYIGISNDIQRRLRQHLNSDEPLANFIRNNFADACGWRLDLFEIDNKEERLKLERQLVQYFRPQFNQAYLGKETK